MTQEFFSYDPHDLDRLDRLQQERDEAMGLVQHSPVPLELAADRRRTDLMDALDDAKGLRAPDPLPPRLAQNQASNNARRRVVTLWDGPTAHEAVAGGARGDSIDMATPLHPTTAHTLTRLLRQQGNEQAASSVERTQGRPW